MTNQAKAYLFGISTVLLWSTVASAFKLSLRHMEPLQLLLYANITSILVLFIVLVIQGQFNRLLKTRRRALIYAALLGLLNPFLYYLVLFKAYDLLPAQEAQPLNYTWAITLSILAVPLLNQRLRRIDLIAILISYFGILVIATHGDPLSLNFGNKTGVLLALGSTLIWAFYWIFSTKFKIEPIIGLFLNFLFAFPFILITTWLSVGFTIKAAEGLLGAAYVGLFEMGIAYILWLKAMRLTESVAKIANLIFLSPILSLYLIHLFVGEEIHWSSGLGLFFIILGNLFQRLGKRTPAKVEKGAQAVDQIANREQTR